MTGGAPSGEDLDKVIVRLRLAIKENDHSSATMTTKSRDTIQYFPYFLLAKALSLKNDADGATQCLDKEFKSSGFDRSSFSEEAKVLRTTLEAARSKNEFIRLASDAIEWDKGAGDVFLSPEGRNELDEVRKQKTKLENATSTSNAVPVIAELESALQDLVNAELGWRNGRLGELSRVPWRVAANPEDCPSSQDATTIEGAKRAKTVLEKCARTLNDAQKRAAQGLCDGWERERDRMKTDWNQLLEDAGALGQTVERADPPVEPKECGELQGAEVRSPSRINAAFETLRDSREKYDIQLQNIRSKIENAKADLDKKVNGVYIAAAGKIPDIRPDCARELQLGKVTEELAELKKTLQSPAENRRDGLDRAMSGVGTGTEELRRQIHEGVQSLVKAEAECPGVATNNLRSLPDLEAAYLKEGGQERLNRLCDATVAAGGDINEYWKGKCRELRDKVSGYVSVLQGLPGATQGTVDRLLDRTSGGLQQGFEKLRSLMASAGECERGPSWITSARQALGDTATAIKDVRRYCEQACSQLPDRLKRNKEILEKLPEGAGGAAGLPSRAELDRDMSRIETCAVLYPAPPRTPDTGAEFVRTLSKLSSEIPSPLPASVHVPDPTLIVRDIAALPAFAQVWNQLDQWEPGIRGALPTFALSAAYEKFGQGSVDDAILELRRSRARGDLTDLQQNVAWLSHAVLSYFLFVKERAMASGEGGTAVTALLANDARRECEKARAKAPGLRLDGKLFSESFIRYYQGCSSGD